MIKDLRYAYRMLRRNPGFTLVAVSSLAIGIGANSTIFSLADALLLRPLPVLRPSEVVSVVSNAPGLTNPNPALSYRDYVDVRDRNHSFSGTVAYVMSSFGFSHNAASPAQMRVGMYVSGNLFQVLGVEPTLGRGFRAEEDVAVGRNAVVVLSHQLWTSEFGSDPGAIGKKIRLNGTEFTIIGVAPEPFTGLDQYLRPALYVPIAMSPGLMGSNLLENRGANWLTVKARLKPGVTLPQAQSDLASLSAALKREYPAINQNETMRVQTELQMRIEASPPDSQLVAMLMALAGCVLLVATANVAGLLLTRSRARVHEIALRLAIGANRQRLVRQLMLESLLIALLGGAAGLGVALLGSEFLSQVQLPSDLPLVIAIQIDQRAVVFTLVISVLSTVFFGLAPALRMARTDLVTALRAKGGDGSRQGRLWGRNLLVGGQVAVSLVLLIVAGLLYRGIAAQLGVGPGFRTNHLLMLNFDPTLVRYTPAQTDRFYRQLLDKVRTTPGVTSAALTSVIPMGNSQEGEQVVPEGYTLPRGQAAVSLFASTVTEDYFKTLGVSLVRGRGILRTDDAHAPRVAVVNEEFAKRYWPNQDPIGKRFHLSTADSAPWQVIGVAKTTKYLWIEEPPTEFIYLPLGQHTRTDLTLLVGTNFDAASLTPALRHDVQEIDAKVPVYGIRTMSDFYRQRVVKIINMIVQTIGAMGALGLVLAMIGLYGLIAYSVNRRTREIGIRMAIGADRSRVMWDVLKQGIALSLGGTAVGIVLALLASRTVTAVFASIKIDPVVFLIFPPLLLALTLVATYAPARRASLVDPMRALRDE